MDSVKNNPRKDALVLLFLSQEMRVLDGFINVRHRTVGATMRANLPNITAPKQRRNTVCRSLRASAFKCFCFGYTGLVPQASSARRVKTSLAAFPVDLLGRFRQEVPMPIAFDGYVERLATMSSTCLVAVACNRYSVPCELAGQRVSIRLPPAG